MKEGEMGISCSSQW